MWGVIGGVVKRGCGRSAGKALRGASSAPLRHAALVLQTSIRCYHASKVRWSSLDGLRKPREAAQGSVDASALPELMRQLALDPANAELHFRVGLEYHRLTEAAPALEAFQRAVDLSPSHWPYLFHLATLQQECGMSDRAIKTFEAALRIDAERPESFSNLALAYKQVGRIGDAVALLKKGVAKHPAIAKLWNNLGILMLESPSFAAQESVACCEKAVALDPEHPEFRQNLATALREAERYKDASREYAIAVDSVTTRKQTPPALLADMYHNWAVCLQKMGQLELASDKWKLACEIQPSNRDAQASYIASLIVMQDDFNADRQRSCVANSLDESQRSEFAVLLAVAIREAGRPEEARKYLKQVLQTDPGYTDAYVELGVTLAEEGKFDQAIPYFAKAVGLAPRDARIWNYLGAARRHFNDVDGAVEAYQMALKCDPDYLDAAENLASVFFERNQDKDAIALYEKLVQSRPNDSDIHASLATLYQRNDLAQKAGYHRDIALKLNPNDWMTVFNTALHHFQNKEMDKANELFDRAIKMNPSLANDFEPFRKHLEDIPNLDESELGSGISEEKLQEEVAKFDQLFKGTDFGRSR